MWEGKVIKESGSFDDSQYHINRNKSWERVCLNSREMMVRLWRCWQEGRMGVGISLLCFGVNGRARNLQQILTFSLFLIDWFFLTLTFGTLFLHFTWFPPHLSYSFSSLKLLSSPALLIFCGSVLPFFSSTHNLMLPDGLHPYAQLATPIQLPDGHPPLDRQWAWQTAQELNSICF